MYQHIYPRVGELCVAVISFNIPNHGSTTPELGNVCKYIYYLPRSSVVCHEAPAWRRIPSPFLLFVLYLYTVNWIDRHIYPRVGGLWLAVISSIFWHMVRAAYLSQCWGTMVCCGTFLYRWLERPILIPLSVFDFFILVIGTTSISTPELGNFLRIAIFMLFYGSTSISTPELGNYCVHWYFVYRYMDRPTYLPQSWGIVRYSYFF